MWRRCGSEYHNWPAHILPSVWSRCFSFRIKYKQMLGTFAISGVTEKGFAKIHWESGIIELPVWMPFSIERFNSLLKLDLTRLSVYWMAFAPLQELNRQPAVLSSYCLPYKHTRKNYYKGSSAIDFALSYNVGMTYRSDSLVSAKSIQASSPKLWFCCCVGREKWVQLRHLRMGKKLINWNGWP